jgi:UDP-3-O-acyl-N-acetylglucosamine deacetylase
MLLKRHILSKPVIVEGYNFFGRWTKLHIEPTTKHQPGVYWKAPTTNLSFEDVEINKNLLDLRKNTLCFRKGKAIAKTVEHFMGLRWALGLDAVKFSIAQGENWPPYLTLGEHVRQILEQDALIEDGVVQFFYPDECIGIHPNDSRRFTFVTPHTQDELMIDVRINYPGLGDFNRNYTITPELIEEIMNEKPQGWPKVRYHASKLLTRYTNKWKHHGSIVWPQEQEDAMVTNVKFANHRCVDTLGDFACWDHLRLPSKCLITSALSGHKMDFLAMHAVPNTRGSYVPQKGALVAQ